MYNARLFASLYSLTESSVFSSDPPGSSYRPRLPTPLQIPLRGTDRCSYVDSAVEVFCQGGPRGGTWNAVYVTLALPR
jgi:hypothetical protein